MRKLACFGVLLFAAWAADRPDINGKWVLDAAHSESGKLKSETLSINQKDDAVQISDEMTESSGKAVKFDVSCNTEGQECKVDESGQPAKVSFWYNGPMLVMMEQRHGNDFVTKKRFKPSEDGKTLSMEVVYIAPPGHKAENYKFTKQ
jgi:hypothetical protein